MGARSSRMDGDLGQLRGRGEGLACGSRRDPGAAGEKSRWSSGQNPGSLLGLTPLSGRPSPSVKEVIRTNPMLALFYQSPGGLQAVAGRLYKRASGG